VSINHILDVFIDSLKDENLEVRNTAAKVFTGVLRCSQRSQIPNLRVSWGYRDECIGSERDRQERFLAQERAVRLPKKSDANYTEAMLVLHSAILGLCALVDCFPYVVEEWVPPLIEGKPLAECTADPLLNILLI
jgi:proteasome activator subunit 4